MTTRLLLLVDDNPDESLLLTRALARGGLPEWKILGLPNGPLALDYLGRAQAGEVPLPDLLLIDVRMAPIGGLQLLERVRKQLPELPAVMFSTLESLADKIRAMDSGARGYFVKSPTFSDLVEFLRTFKPTAFAMRANALTHADAHSGLTDSFSRLSSPVRYPRAS